MTSYIDLQAEIEATEKALKEKKARAEKLKTEERIAYLEAFRYVAERTLDPNAVRQIREEAKYRIELKKELRELNEDILPKLTSKQGYRKKKLDEQPDDEERILEYEDVTERLENVRARRDDIKELLSELPEKSLGGIAISQDSYPEHEPPTQSDFS